MTYFEQVGVNYQLQAKNKEQALASFEYSCDVCTRKLRCLYNECKHCAINQTHTQVMAIFTDKNKEDK